MDIDSNDKTPNALNQAAAASSFIDAVAPAAVIGELSGVVASASSTSSAHKGGADSRANPSTRGLKPPRIDTEEDFDVESDDERAEGAPPREPKNRFAVFFGYVGARYQGLQKCVYSRNGRRL
jgi:hypothetical protein